MLANAYLPLITAIFGAAASLLLAIVLELPILKLLWRWPLLRLAGWVLLANLVSAGVGVVPVFYDTGPGMKADPWEVSQHWRLRQGIHVGLLLVLTLAAEGIVYHLLNRRAVQRVHGSRLVLGLLTCNLASYGVVIGLSLATRRPDPQVQLLPDTAWLKHCDERLWFVERGSHRLCSVRLDGTDRRTEIEAPLGRLQTGFYDVSLYALFPNDQSIVFVSPELEWRLAEPGGIRSLGAKVEPDDRGYLFASDAVEGFPEVLEKANDLGIPATGPVWSNILPQICRPVVMSDETGGYRASTLINGGGGTGMGLSLQRPDRTIEFRIPAGPAYLACCEPAILPDRKLVVFRCSAWIMVMDIETGRVGRLVEGDSLVVLAPAFNWLQQEPRSRSKPPTTGPSTN